MKIHVIPKTNTTTALAFLTSANVNAYPCGRRRSELYQLTKRQSEKDQEYIPFDPEARLTTEATKRIHPKIDSYFDEWYEPNVVQAPANAIISGYFKLVLDNYYFKITLDDLEKTPEAFAAKLVAALEVDEEKQAEINQLYANIRIEQTPLLAHTDLKYQTGVLRNQTATATPALSLDCLIPGKRPDEGIDSFFFSGLSFSTAPITGEEFRYKIESDVDGLQLLRPKNVSSKVNIYANNVTEVSTNRSENQLYQTWVSLCFLVKEDGAWKINSAALLPKISAGLTSDSIVVSDVTADDLSANSVITKDISAQDATSNTMRVTNSIVLGEKNYRVPALALDKHEDDDEIIRLHFYTGFSSALQPDEPDTPDEPNTPEVPDTPVDPYNLVIDFTDINNRMSYDEEQQVWSQNGITVTNNRGDCTCTAKIGIYGGNGFPARFYSKSDITIEYPGMQKLVIDCTNLDAKYYYNWTKSCEGLAASGVTAVNENGYVIISFAEAIDSFTIENLQGQTRAYSITVYCNPPEETPEEAVDDVDELPETAPEETVAVLDDVLDYLGDSEPVSVEPEPEV